MAFSRFGYDPSALPGLEALLKTGPEVLAALKQKIQTVEKTWVPEHKHEYLFVDFLDNYYLVFAVSEQDSSCLVLAAVEQQPRL